MTQTKQIEKVVISAEPTWKKENIINRKTVVYETQMDPAVARATSEKLKNQLFTRYRFFRPKSEEIQFVSMEKFYEPYIAISGRYFIDYFCKSVYCFKINDNVKEVVILNTRFFPENSGNVKTIKLDGEERLVREIKSFLIMDKNGQDAQLDNLPSAPSEKKPEKAIEKYAIEEIPQNMDIELVRARIARRPDEISRIMEETFEITERTVFYTPRFKIKFKNMRTKEEKTLVIDGVSSRRII